MDETATLPSEIEIGGATYRRVEDFTADTAAQLLKRIEGVANATGTDYKWATWAIMYEDAISTGKPLPTPPEYWPLPTSKS
jgi:hypothetical protein